MFGRFSDGQGMYLHQIQILSNEIPRRPSFTGHQAIPSPPCGLGVMVHHHTGTLPVDTARNPRNDFLKYVFFRSIGGRRQAANDGGDFAGLEDAS